MKIFQAAWDKAKEALDGSVPMTTQATAEELTAYQYRFHRTKRELQKIREKLDARKAAADESSKRRADLSTMSGNSANNRGWHGRTNSRMHRILENDRGEYLIHDLDMSFMSVDSRGNIMPKTPEAAYMAVVGT